MILRSYARELHAALPATPVRSAESQRPSLFLGGDVSLFAYAPRAMTLMRTVPPAGQSFLRAAHTKRKSRQQSWPGGGSVADLHERRILPRPVCCNALALVEERSPIMITILLSIAFDGLMMFWLSSLDNVGTIAFVVFSFPLVALLIGVLMIAGGQKLLGARIVAIASLLFLPLGVLGILGARNVMNALEPTPGDDLKTRDFFIRPLAYYVAGAFLAVTAFLMRDPSTFVASAFLFCMGFWRNLTPLIRIFPTSVVVDNGFLLQRRVVPRRQFTSYDVTGDSITIRFERKGKSHTLKSRTKGMSADERQQLRSELERFAMMDPFN